MASLLQRQHLCEDPRVLSVATILRSSEYSTPIQSHGCHSMPDPDLPVSTAITVPSSSVFSTSYMQSRSETYNCDADYLEDEASKDFWSEFEFSGLTMNQRGVDEINQEVDDDQMGRPVLTSRKRHKGLLGGVTEGTNSGVPMISTLLPGTRRGKAYLESSVRHCGHQRAEMETNQELYCLVEVRHIQKNPMHANTTVVESPPQRNFRKCCCFTIDRIYGKNCGPKSFTSSRV